MTVITPTHRMSFRLKLRYQEGLAIIIRSRKPRLGLPFWLSLLYSIVGVAPLFVLIQSFIVAFIFVALISVGKVMAMVVPSPALLSTSMVPWCELIIPYTTERPHPFPFSFEVKKGSKILGRSFSSMPTPLSAISTRTAFFRLFDKAVVTGKPH